MKAAWPILLLGAQCALSTGCGHLHESWVTPDRSFIKGEIVTPDHFEPVKKELKDKACDLLRNRSWINLEDSKAVEMADCSRLARADLRPYLVRAVCLERYWWSGSNDRYEGQFRLSLDPTRDLWVLYWDRDPDFYRRVVRWPVVVFWTLRRPRLRLELSDTPTGARWTASILPHLEFALSQRDSVTTFTRPPVSNPRTEDPCPRLGSYTAWRRRVGVLCQPSVVSCQLRVVRTAFDARLFPEPRTPNPEPQTPNLKPETRNPKLIPCSTSRFSGSLRLLPTWRGAGRTSIRRWRC